MYSLCFAQAGNLIHSPTHFEGACALQILGLEIDVGSQHCAEGARAFHRGHMDGVMDDLASMLDLAQGWGIGYRLEVCCTHKTYLLKYHLSNSIVTPNFC